MDLRERSVSAPLKHWYFSSKLELLRKKLATIPPDETIRLLDFGSGDGFYSANLAHEGFAKSVTQYDPNFPEDQLTSKYRVNDIGVLNGQRFDVVLLMDVIEHVAQPSGLLREVSNLIADAGYLFVSVPARMELWSSHDEILEHVKRYSKESLADELESAGWEILSLEYHLNFMYPLALISTNLFKRKNRAEMRIPSWLNSMFRVMTMLDFACPWKRHRGITLVAFARLAAS